MKSIVLCLIFFVSVSVCFTTLSHNVLNNARYVTLDKEEKKLYSKRGNDADPLSSFLKRNNIFMLDDIDQLKLSSVFETKMNRKISGYQQYVNGYRVFGANVKLVEKDGEIHSIAGNYFSTLHINSLS